MRIMCVDDEPLALQMLELSVKKAKPDAEVSAFRKPLELLEAAQKNGCANDNSAQIHSTNIHFFSGLTV